MTEPKQHLKQRLDGQERRRRGAGRDRARQRVSQSESRERKNKEERKKKEGEKSLRRIRELLENNGVDPEMIGAVKAVRLNEWEVAAKTGPKGGPKTLESKTLSAASIILEPSWATGPEWPVVDAARPVSVRVPKRTMGPTLLKNGWRTALLIPDPQIGFRRMSDGSLDPFHDERALYIAMQIAEAERPNVIAWTGDFLDFAPMSTKFRREPGFALTTQPGLDAGYAYLAIAAELCESQFMLSGNHDIRLQNMVIDNAQAAFGLRPGGSAPDTWPDLSVQRLLRMDEVNCEYVGAYPAGARYLNDNLAVIHGAALGNKMRTAAQMVVDEERVSVLHGHTHRRAMAAKTRNSRGEAKHSVAYSPGCTCRTDGAVPSTRSQIDAFGRPVTIFEDWQNGVGVIRYEEGDGRFHIEDVPIFVDHKFNYAWAIHGGQEFDVEGGLNVPYSVTT